MFCLVPLLANIPFSYFPATSASLPSPGKKYNLLHHKNFQTKPSSKVTQSFHWHSILRSITICTQNLAHLPQVLGFVVFIYYEPFL